MKLWNWIIAVCAVWCLTGLAQEEADALPPGEYTYAEKVEIEPETKNLSLGLDVRVRYTYFDRDVLYLDGDGPQGPGVSYLRVRERLRLGYDFSDQVRFNMQLVNRWHKVNSHPGNPNDKDSSTWKFPDETIFDIFNVQIKNLGGHYDLTLGRQNVIMGNGMILLEGTPYDQGRTIYFDGAVGTYHDETTKLHLLGLYNRYRDDFIVISDEERRLRRGDQLVLGVYWTQLWDSLFNTDLYALFVDIDDDDDTTGMRGHNADENAKMTVMGVRFFGKPTEFMDYSLEVAAQQGDYQNAERDMRGWMVDARINTQISDCPGKPVLINQYTYFSGDDPSTSAYEGWHPVFSEYPIWREELLPIALNGNWTNLHQFHTGLRTQLHERVTLTTAWFYLHAASSAGYRDPAGNDRGSEFGQLFSSFLDIKLMDNWLLKFEASYFDPGNYFPAGDDSEWLRVETVVTF